MGGFVPYRREVAHSCETDANHRFEGTLVAQEVPRSLDEQQLVPMDHLCSRDGCSIPFAKVGLESVVEKLHVHQNQSES